MKSSLGGIQEKIEKLDKAVDAIIAERDRLRQENQGLREQIADLKEQLKEYRMVNDLSWAEYRGEVN